MTDMKILKLAVAVLLGITTLTGCRDSDSGAPPRADIVFPTRAGVTAAESITVRGISGDDNAVAEVRVNGMLAESTDDFQTWSATLALAPGVNRVSVDVTDNDGNVVREAALVDITRRLEIARPFGFEVDAANNTLYYVDMDQLRIMTVALADGEVEEFADLSQFEPTGPRQLRPVELALDLANDRVFLTVRSDEAVGETSVGIWKFDTVSTTWSAFSDITIDPDAVLANPSDVLLDAANNRLLVVDVDLDVIVAVSLATGEQSILVGNAVPDDSFALFSEPMDAAFDTASNRILVVDRVADAVLAVDLASGAKSLVSGQGVGSGADLDQPLSMTVDATNSRALVFDRWTRSIMAVDLATGERSLFASNADATDGMFIFDVRSMAIHDGELIVLDNVMDHVLAFDLESGARRVVTNNGFPRGESPPALFSLQKIGGEFYGESYAGIGRIAADNSVQVLAGAVDTPLPEFSIDKMVTNSSGSISYVSEWVSAGSSYEHQIRKVDLTDGSATVLSGSTTPDAENFWIYVISMALDEANEQVLVLSPDSVIATDTTTGARRIVSDDGSLPIIEPRQIAIDGANDRALVADPNYEHLVAIDLSTGQKSAFSTTPVDGEVSVESPIQVTVGDDGTVWIIDDGYRLLKVDPQSGARSILIDMDALSESRSDYWSEVFAADGLLYVRAYSGILEVDPITGDIVKVYATPLSSPGSGS
jgi:hypothetical protein